jgi:formate/nitrite transporter
MDAFSPKEIAHLIDSRGIAKAESPFSATFVLAILAGAFIAIGGMLATIVGTDTAGTLGYGLSRWLSGAAFGLGLVLVVVAGAELFTGNNLIVMSVVSRKVRLKRLLYNWGVVYVGNFIGALSVVFMVYLAEWWKLDDGAVGANALTIASVKTSEVFGVAFMRGILANVLVCLAIWLATGGRSVIDKVVAIVFPISAFVAAAFEHSIANMYFIPLGMLLHGQPSVVTASGLTAAQMSHLTAAGLTMNLVAVTLGNIVGGAALVGLVYWFVYVRPAEVVEREHAKPATVKEPHPAGAPA